MVARLGTAPKKYERPILSQRHADQLLIVSCVQVTVGNRRVRPDNAATAVELLARRVDEFRSRVNCDTLGGERCGDQFAVLILNDAAFKQ